MHYFVCYTPYDFPFSVLDSECRMLISPTNIPPSYRFPSKCLPKELFVDSGAYHHNERRSGKTQKECLQEQLRALEAFALRDEVTVLHCDVMQRKGMKLGEAVEQTLRHAREFASTSLPVGMKKMAVAQGGSPEEMFLVVRFLRDLGFEQIAVGGLARMHRTQRAQMMETAEAAGEAADGVNLHALGATGTSILPLLRKSGFTSCDSATPVWGAVYGSVLYSGPLIRYRLNGKKSARADVRPNTGYYEMLDEPLPCPCPVCREDPWLLFGESMLSKHLRSIHNYFHLKAEIEGEHVWQKLCSSAEYRSAIETYLTSMLLSPVTPRWTSSS